MSAVLPAKREDVAGNEMMRLLFPETLDDGTKTIQEVVASAAKRRPEISHQVTGRLVIALKVRRADLE